MVSDFVRTLTSVRTFYYVRTLFHETVAGRKGGPTQKLSKFIEPFTPGSHRQFINLFAMKVL